MRRKRMAGSLWLVWLLAVGAAGSGQNRTYATVQKISLDRRVNGIDGTLELDLDARLATTARETLWGKGEWSFVLPDGSPLYTQFAARAPLGAELKIKDGTGNVVEQRLLHAPLARVEPWNPASRANQFVLLTEDHSAGMGSYSGLFTTLLRVTEGRLHDVTAVDADSRHDEQIRLVRSLKSDWRISRREHGAEILSASCHPTEGGRFVVDYVRYESGQAGWRKYARQVEGYWESDQAFPARSEFR